LPVSTSSPVQMISMRMRFPLGRQSLGDVRAGASLRR
jgi:hypothetical protein